MAVNLTSGALSKMTGKCTSKDLNPVLQVIDIDRCRISTINNKQWYWVVLSDGSFQKCGLIAVQIIISNKLQKGSIVRLTEFQLTKLITSNSKGEIMSKSAILCFDVNVIHSKWDIIDDETPLVERTTHTIPNEDQIHANSHHVEEPPTSKQNQDHVDSLLNENIVDSDYVEEPPLTSTQKCSSHSPTRNKKRELQSSDDIISGSGKDISKHVSTIVEKTIEDGLGACYKTLGTLEEGVLKMTKLMMEKSQEVDAGFKKLETLEEDVSKMTKLMMEKSQEVDAGLKKLETLGEDVSKMAKMMTDKNKEDDMGACIEKLDKIGWVAQDPMYETAILLFGQSADYRKLRLHLKPENCGNWVKNAGNMFGLLD